MEEFTLAYHANNVEYHGIDPADQLYKILEALELPMSINDVEI